MNKSNVIISFDKGLDNYNEPEAMDPQSAATTENSIQQGTGDNTAPSWTTVTPAGWDSTGKVYNVAAVPSASNLNTLAIHGTPRNTRPPKIYDETGQINAGILYPWQQQTVPVVSTTGLNLALPYALSSRPITVIEPLSQIGITVWRATNPIGPSVLVAWAKFSLNSKFTTLTGFLATGSNDNITDVGIVYEPGSNRANFVISYVSSTTTFLNFCAIPVDLTSDAGIVSTVGLGGAAITWMRSATFNNKLYLHTNAVTALREFTYTGPAVVSSAAITGPVFGGAKFASIYSSTARSNAGRLSILGRTGAVFQVATASAPGTWTIITTTTTFGSTTATRGFHCSFDTPGTNTLAGFSIGTEQDSGNVTPVTGWTYNWSKTIINSTNATGTQVAAKVVNLGGPAGFLADPIVPAHTPVTGLEFGPEAYFPVYCVYNTADPWNIAKVGGYNQRVRPQMYFVVQECFSGQIDADTNTQIIATSNEYLYLPTDGIQLKFSITSGVNGNNGYQLNFGFGAAQTFDGLSTSILTFGQTTPNDVIAKCIRFTQNAVSQSAAPVSLGQNVFFPGTVEGQFDGQMIQELSFFQTPGPLAAVTSTAGGAMAQGNVYYRYNYTYVDKNGAIHESPYSAPFAVLTGAGSTNSVTLAAFKLGASLRLRSNSNFASINFYRTETSAGTSTTFTTLPYYFIGSVLNDLSTLVHVTFTDTLNDLTLVQRNLASISDGRSPRRTPPSFISHAVFQQRLWGISYESGYNLWVSYPYVDTSPPFGVGFGANTTIDVPVDVGEVKAIAPLDGSLIVFGAGADFYVTGDAQIEGQSKPDKPKVQGPLPSPGGMVAPNSFVRIPEGLLYQSEQGFMLLNRGGTYDFKGKNVRALTNLNIYGRGGLIAAQNYVYFPNLSAPAGTEAIAYNYVEDRWFTLKSVYGPAGLAASIPRRVAGSPTPQIISIAPNGYNILNFDLGEQKILESAWLQPGGLNGYGEISDMVLLGKWEGPHQLSVETAWDYGPYGTAQIQDIFTNPGDYQYRFSPPQTQVRAIRYRITITPLAAPGFPGLNAKTAIFFGIMLELGGDPALSRLANTRNR